MQPIDKEAETDMSFPALYRKPLAKLFDHFRFRREFRRFASMIQSERFEMRWSDRYPCLKHRTLTTPFDRHYVYHTAWAARILARTRPAEHIDIASSIYFAALVSAFIPVRFFDYRPPDLQLHGLKMGRVDLHQLPFPDSSILSLSCMHVVEHVGLGRYGDPLDPEGDLKAISELKRVTAVGGDLLFVVPVGQGKLMFNAHRIYGYDQILGCFDGFDVIEFGLVADASYGQGLVFPLLKRSLTARNTDVAASGSGGTRERRGEEQTSSRVACVVERRFMNDSVRLGAVDSNFCMAGHKDQPGTRDQSGRCRVVIAKLKGGLGNQMFQYATARRLAWILNAELKLDISWFKQYQERFCGLQGFRTIDKIASKKRTKFL